jgi:3-phosphoshikimate 1-carboxyvinyltransferase
METTRVKQLRIEPIAKVDGVINLPGSKSLSNRALLLAALADGVTEIRNLLDSDDIRHMLNALGKLGVSFELSEDKTVCKVTGNGGAFENDAALELFLGNAGTAMRPLCAALCLGKGEYTLTGEPRMEERPIDALIDALREAGCELSYLKNEGFPPVKISASGMRGGKVNIDGSISSQFLTALLMAAPMAQEDSEITIIGELVSKPYILITLDIMEKFGIKVENEDYRVFKIKGGQTYQSPGVFMVEGDASSASYFMAAAAIKGGVVRGLGNLACRVMSSLPMFWPIWVRKWSGLTTIFR